MSTSQTLTEDTKAIEPSPLPTPSPSPSPSLSPSPSPSPESALVSLPLELKQMILSFVPNIQTLRAAVLCHSSLFTAYITRQAPVLQSVLENQIGPEVLHEALFVLESGLERPWTQARAKDLLTRYFDRQPARPEIDFTNALRISEMHQHLSFFVSQFATSALSLHPVTRDEEDPPAIMPLSRSEHSRISRVLYRFQLYCNLFSQHVCADDLEAEGLKPWADFFPNFAPWENEQLLCIHDYLYNCLTPEFENVVQHDVDWAGFYSVEFNDGPFLCSNPWKEHFLSLGLPFLHTLKTACSDESQHEILCQALARNEDFLSRTIELEENALSVPFHVALDEFSEEEFAMWIHPPFTQELDKGPELAWRRIRSENDFIDWTNYSETYFLRKRGYVLWDSARLQGWKLLEAPLRQVKDDLRNMPLTYDDVDAKQRRVHANGDSLWRQGHRGFWKDGLDFEMDDD